MQEERKEVPAWYRRESLQEDRDSFQVEYTVYSVQCTPDSDTAEKEGRNVSGVQVVMSDHAGVH
jgi:hypothetical protein